MSLSVVVIISVVVLISYFFLWGFIIDLLVAIFPVGRDRFSTVLALVLLVVFLMSMFSLSDGLISKIFWLKTARGFLFTLLGVFLGRRNIVCLF